LAAFGWFFAVKVPCYVRHTRRIRAKLVLLPVGQPVGYADFVREPADFGVVTTVLSRLSKRGELKRLAKGFYYWPVTGRFCPVLLAEAGPAPYPTGLAVCNAMELPAGATLLTQPFLRSHPVTNS
jgi:hypothetical protein